MVVLPEVLPLVLLPEVLPLVLPEAERLRRLRFESDVLFRLLRRLPVVVLLVVPILPAVLP